VTGAPVGAPAPNRLRFDLPPDLEAGAPAEARGTTRDAVRMIVAYRHDGRLVHSTFALVGTFLDPGDLVVVNTSATLPAALTGVDPATGAPVAVHLSTELDDGRWVVEPRVPAARSAAPWPAGEKPPALVLFGEDGSHMELVGPYRGATRLWVARLHVPGRLRSWLAVHGQPIRYAYAERPWPLSAYQNVYATEPGSAEMPSAGRPFTPEIVTRLVAKGVAVSPVVLHTGVASLDAGELPYPERVRVPPWTARRVNATRRAGGRGGGQGPPQVRALESAHDAGAGEVQPLNGWTDLVVTPERGVAAVDGMLTGWHEPDASHLLMLEAVAGRSLLEASYAASLAEGYLWHEFGDVHLILP
jgi:S-adenosylmethionine:tRNA ribosyltransferase-isomerase